MRKAEFLVITFIIAAFCSAQINVLPIEVALPADESRSYNLADYEVHDPILISSDDDFETQGWPGSGTPEEPYKIEGLSIDGSSSEICVSIENTRSYFIIRNCYLFNGTHGIHLDNVTNAEIEHCEIDLIIIGIEIADSWNNTITHNTLIGQTSIPCENGLVLWTAFNTTLSHNNCSGSWSKGIYHNYSDNCTISNNICSSGGGESYGIWIRVSNYITLLNNTCNMNSEDGILITGTNQNTILINNTCNMNGEIGFHISGLVNCSAINNTAIGNRVGLRVGSGVDCVLTDNTMMNNDMVGIQLQLGAQFTKVYRNILGWSNLNGRDDGSDNSWDDGVSIGNRWGDYNGSEPYYSIYGLANSVDHYPLKADIISPMVDTPADIECEFGTAGNFITWSPSDDHPETYSVYREGVLIESDIWYGFSITVDIDSLELGAYNYTLIVFDTNGNTGNDTVIVTVLDTTEPIIDGPDDFHYEYGTTNNRITWIIIELKPHYFEIIRNETQIDSGPWDGSDIEILIDGLDFGTYNFTLVVFDTSNNNASSTVIISVADTINPMISNLEDTQFTVGATGHNLTWILQDTNPFSYEVVMHSIVIASGTWNSTGETVTITLDSMTVGTHFITITITDLAGNEASDVVIVSILPESTTTTDTTGTITTSPTTDSQFQIMDVLGLGIGVGVLLSVIVFVVLRKRE